ncbi:allophanate hydrolase [Mycobacterium antarcticum]|uniref:5-oxoprolinase subunit B family protein n=1 Tax=unclassified Mycolicibacterium TaxID=2636767 RepID=UPI0023A12FAD|nr:MULTISPECIES: carboxyltransferase domain-containing protein [unclassified Mycolicibacterium]BDX34800.1 allophanate hydrolase [Mycolicibacterium sp. TUM20985]GLP78001.1 allophanate hydrolase [Mycolicibacterium sp. TUM20983]GLP81596.1 allophanate hydrolase [Mycolicibacterium sp. TUM20984]
MSLRAVHDYGDRALLLDLDDTADVLAWCDALRVADAGGVVDIVPASRTVLLLLAGPEYQATTRAHLHRLREQSVGAAAATPATGADVTIDVVYDGEDLADVARLTGLSPDQVVAAHTAAPMRVGFIGFVPGFAYLVGGDERLHVPRRPEPRTRVPVGSVGLAGEFSGVYPRESPGGWQLIGRTDAVLWDIDRDPPALLTPGTLVRFRAIGGGST